MDLISIIVIIGVVYGIIGSIKDLFKKSGEGNKEYRNSYREVYIKPLEEISPKKVVNKKKKKPSERIDNIYTVDKSIDKVDVITKNKNIKQKKNPFEITKNPVTNAIIASEILGKPKCKR